MHDLTGQRFGLLVVIGRSERKIPHGSLWRCHCDCGREREVRSAGLRRKHQPTRSCGCLSGANHRTHGEANKVTPEYMCWHAIKTRCFNVGCAAYRNYGGRGITMCDRWRDSYSAFLADVGRRPSDAHSIDRIDNDGHYEPGNVRWVTGSEQQQNRRPYSEWMQRHRAADGTFVAH
jgi:hypothetical protein